MEGVVGRGSRVIPIAVDEGQHAATVCLLNELKQSLAEQVLLTLAAMDYHGQKLLDILYQVPISSRTCNTLPTGSEAAVTERPITR